jgi:hypothetical protein
MTTRPKTGDVVIWEMEAESTMPSYYWVRTHDRGSAAQLFEGPDAWMLARRAAEERAGSDGDLWRRHTDGRFEKLSRLQGT